MAEQDTPRLPEIAPNEARRRAEDCLGLGDIDTDVVAAVAWGLLAVAGELAVIRRDMRKR
ncbi:hypothetical protein ACFW9O_05990 [Streptomyces sp. NPDC059499]|uniref:hypothetical protein n=1 Tax=Streptomyces sp. NPDC059499 TaxID=3346852 RepID=UPI0036A5EE1C